MAFPTTSILDDFNRASLGSNWTAIYNTCSIESSVRLKGDSSDFGIIEWNVGDIGPDYEMYYQIVTKPSTNEYMNGTLFDPDTYSGYGMVAQTYSGTDELYIVRYDAGTPTTLRTVVQEITNGYWLGISRIDNVFQLYYGSAVDSMSAVGSSVTDDTYPDAARLHIGIGDTTARVDNFGGGTITAGGTTSFLPHIMRHHFIPRLIGGR